MGHRILVVEDQQFLRRFLVNWLREHDYLVDDTADAEDALERLGRNSYDVVLCDVHLPGASGLELLRCLTDDEHHVRFVLMTGDPGEDIERAGRANGAAACLRKPFSFEELQEALSHALSGPN
jgi:CheY-like chemotaxis protein